MRKTKGEKAELILRNGQFWTLDPDFPEAEAVAVQNGRFTAVGSWDRIKDWTGKSTRLIDLDGAFVVPGFIDSHTHFLEGALSLASLDLRDVRSREEFVKKIKNEAAKLEKGKWITNGEWDQRQFDSRQLPRKEWIDGVTPENPVCLSRKDLHTVFVNSLALKIAGISKHTPHPEGGTIVKDTKTGKPTGILIDGAVDLVSPFIPEPDRKEKLAAAERAIEFANKKGVTSVHEMGPLDNLSIYEELHLKNRLNLRVCLYPPISLMGQWEGSEIKSKKKGEFYKIGGLKGFVDGSLGSSTALFFKSYADDADKRGILAPDMFPKGKMEERLKKADKMGLQVAVHAIGDKANNIILDIFENIIRSSAKRDRRWRIEHAQHLMTEDVIRMGRLGVIASVQPYHLIDDGQWAEKKIGPSRVRFSYPFKSLLENEVMLAFGSDWTVAPLEPLLGIYSAVTRRTLDGKNPHGWIPEEKISVREAIKGYTVNAAFAEFSENIKGSIREGFLADMVVLDRNILDREPVEIKDVQVIMTVFNGRIVYQR
jgi:predicted amidohydrolase YtcJ